MHGFDWAGSAAQALLDGSVSPADAEATEEGARKNEPPRYATRNGIAFKTVPSNDGTWHGYPVPWESVPNEFRRSWLKEKKVTQREIRMYSASSLTRRYEGRDLNEWPLETDDE